MLFLFKGEGRAVYFLNIVIQPYVQDGWRKALSRTVGTVGRWSG